MSAVTERWKIVNGNKNVSAEIPVVPLFGVENITEAIYDLEKPTEFDR
jgi:hypothetical protein